MDGLLIDSEPLWRIAEVEALRAVGVPITEEDALETTGLRTDFQGKLFPGSATLLGIADDLSELKTICFCGRKATMNLRIDQEGRALS